MKSLHFIVTGRVQGVGYRNWCQKTADSLKISGWVKNRDDGAVEGVAQGEKLNDFSAALWKGPRFAAVEKVASSIVEDEAIYSEFAIVRE